MDDVKDAPKKKWQTPSLKEVDVSKATAGVPAACSSGAGPGAGCTAGTGPAA